MRTGNGAGPGLSEHEARPEDCAGPRRASSWQHRDIWVWLPFLPATVFLSLSTPFPSYWPAYSALQIVYLIAQGLLCVSITSPLLQTLVHFLLTSGYHDTPCLWVYLSASRVFRAWFPPQEWMGLVALFFQCFPAQELHCNQWFCMRSFYRLLSSLQFGCACDRCRLNPISCSWWQRG